MLLIKATLAAKRVGTYEGREFASLQFLEQYRNSLQLIEVAVPDDVDHSTYVVGQEVEIAVSVSYSKKNSKLYFRMEQAAA